MIGPRAGLDDAVPDTAADVKASLAAGAVEMENVPAREPRPRRVRVDRVQLVRAQGVQAAVPEGDDAVGLDARTVARETAGPDASERHRRDVAVDDVALGVLDGHDRLWADRRVDRAARAGGLKKTNLGGVAHPPVTGGLPGRTMTVRTVVV